MKGYKVVLLLFSKDAANDRYAAWCIMLECLGLDFMAEERTTRQHECMRGMI